MKKQQDFPQKLLKNHKKSKNPLENAKKHASYGKQD